MALIILTLQAFLEAVWSNLQLEDLKWSVIPPQETNPLILFQEITKDQVFQGLSIQIRSDRSFSVFKDQDDITLPELVPERLQTFTDVMALVQTIETSQCCPGITDEKYRDLIGRSILKQAIVQENPFSIRPIRCNWLRKVFCMCNLPKTGRNHTNTVKDARAI